MVRRGLILLLTLHVSLAGLPVVLARPAVEPAAPAPAAHCPCCPDAESCHCCPKDVGGDETPARDGQPVMRQCRCAQHHALLLTSTELLLTTSVPAGSYAAPLAGRVIGVREVLRTVHLPPDSPPPRSGK